MSNFIRTCKLVVGDGAGKTLDLSGLRVHFETVSQTTEELAGANVIVSNVSRATFALVQKEFTKLVLVCGYERGSEGIIFSGTITQVEYGEREGWTDPLLRIWARDGDAGYTQATVSKTLAKGWTPQDKVDAAADALKPFGIAMGRVLGVDLSKPASPRGTPLSGLARDILREVAGSKGATWNLHDGKLNIVHNRAQIPGDGIVLNEDTGLVGQPIQRVQGVLARCLINSAIQVNTIVKIDQASIVKTDVKDVTLDTTGGDANLQQELSTQGVADGRYRVLQIHTTGDTRGPPWYMDLVLLGATTGVISSTQASLGFTVPVAVQDTDNTPLTTPAGSAGHGSA